MMNDIKYEYATLEEYGYKEHKILKNLWKISKVILLAFSVIMLYLAVIVIAIQSFNSSDSTTEFVSFTFDNYINMFGKSSLNNSIINTFKTSVLSTDKEVSKQILIFLDLRLSKRGIIFSICNSGSPPENVTPPLPLS
jgi:hypothetical protein